MHKHEKNIIFVFFIVIGTTINACPRKLWVINRASEDIRACVEARDCMPTSKHNIQMNSVRLFPYAHLQIHPMSITIEGSRIGSCSYDLECKHNMLFLKRRGVAIDSFEFGESDKDVTLIIGDDCRIMFSKGDLLDSYEAIRRPRQ